MSRLVYIGLSFALLLALVPGPAQSASGYTRKVILDNARTTVTMSTWLPGATSPSATRGPRVIFYLTATKLKRNYADGHTSLISQAAGSTAYRPKDPQPNSITNVGTNTVRLYTVTLK